MPPYNFKAIEKQWQLYWEQKATFSTSETKDKPKFYVLDMFPYPSGAGLHVGHLLGYVASDVVARYKRSRGYNVLHPMGFDAFGLPAEQYALQTGQHPTTTTNENICYYKEQLTRLGLSFDWTRSIRTSAPTYYRWTQWIFIQLFQSWYDKHAEKARSIEVLIHHLNRQGNVHLCAACDVDTPTITAENWNAMSEQAQQMLLLKYRLAFLETTTVNWCPALSTVLANEEVKDGYAVRGGHPVVRKKMRQWSLRITAYAKRLLKDLTLVDWPTSIKDVQRHWIGESQGAIITFQVATTEEVLHRLLIFTSRPETIFGVTYLAVAPEHPLVDLLTIASQQEAVARYMSEASKRAERERLADKEQATGIFTGSYAKHPFTDQLIPIWITDYVIATYGTGAIMGVPGHDHRDYKFAKQFNLPIVRVTTENDEEHTTQESKLINSSFLNDLTLTEATRTVIDQLKAYDVGHATTTLRLRNSVFSRQRYWGEPLPIYYKESIPYPLSEDELPLKLPPIQTYQPTSEGDPPLGHATHWCTKEGYPLALSTMPSWAGSSWYFLRYMDPHNTSALVGAKPQHYWKSVDLYIGGAEHATGHLLYARFWTKFLYDRGYINIQEPFDKLINQGMLQSQAYLVYPIKGTQTFVSYGLREKYDTTSMYIATELVEQGILNQEAFKQWRPELQKATFILEDGAYRCGQIIEKMSKSKHNVINPDTIISQYGADTLRLYILFLGPLQQSKPWDTHGIDGAFRFLNKLWRLVQRAHLPKTNHHPTPPSSQALIILHRTIRSVQHAIERYTFNTAISALMVGVNELTGCACNHPHVLRPLLIIIAPFAPHIAEACWQHLGGKTSITHAAWPRWESNYVEERTYTYPITVNGRVRAKLTFEKSTRQEEIEKHVLAHPSIQRWTQGKTLRKIIVVPQRIVNVVV